MTTQIQLRRDTSTNWSAANPVLAEGEIGMDMTVNAFKVGDGASAWNDIDYAGTDITLDDYYTKVEADDAFQPKGDYLTDFVEEDPTVPDHVKGITQDDIEGWNAGGSGGTGSSVHIGDTPPANPSEGQQWMEVPASGEATMWIYDSGNDGQWLQHPSGKDGAPGADGNIADGSQDGVVATWNSTAGQWTPDSSLTIDATGNATFSGNVNWQNGTTDARIGTNVFNSGDNLAIGTVTNHSINFYTNNVNTAPRLTIDATGNATFSGTVNAGGDLYAGTLHLGGPLGRTLYAQSSGGNSGFHFGNLSIQPVDATGQTTNGTVSLGTSASKFNVVHSVTTRSDRVFSSGHLVTSTRDLIETLSTLRNATKDETTIKGLRDAIGNAVGGLIEKFEAMQSEAVTQEISDE